VEDLGAAAVARSGATKAMCASNIPSSSPSGESQKSGLPAPKPMKAPKSIIRAAPSGASTVS
jgi:hypothetical protein